jgi:hypothetical protein
MFEPHQSHFVVRVETMTDAERRLTDRQAGIMARAVWELCRGVAGRARALRLLALSTLGALAPRAGNGGEAAAEACREPRAPIPGASCGAGPDRPR